MFKRLYLLIAAFSVRLLAKVSSPSCFVVGNGPFGSKSGNSFTDLDQLNSDIMTVEMRVAQALVCTDRNRRSVQGLQFSLKDTNTKF